MDTLYRFLQKIRKRPRIYLGEPSITALRHFIYGYGCCFRLNKICVDNTCLDGFQEYVQKYYNTRLTKDWAGLILDHSANEKEAFEKFFELLDEHLTSDSNTKNSLSFLPQAIRERILGDEYHGGVLYEGKVYCNVHQQGLPLMEWTEYFKKLGFNTQLLINKPIVNSEPPRV